MTYCPLQELNVSAPDEPAFLALAADLGLRLAAACAESGLEHITIGLQGFRGSGKSTLAIRLASAFASAPPFALPDPPDRWAYSHLIHHGGNTLQFIFLDRIGLCAGISEKPERLHNGITFIEHADVWEDCDLQIAIKRHPSIHNRTRSLEIISFGLYIPPERFEIGDHHKKTASSSPPAP